MSSQPRVPSQNPDDSMNLDDTMYWQLMEHEAIGQVLSQLITRPGTLHHQQAMQRRGLSVSSEDLELLQSLGIDGTDLKVSPDRARAASEDFATLKSRRSTTR
jgi:hypothetical protein